MTSARSDAAPRIAWDVGLTRKRTAVSVLIRDTVGGILLVEPRYKENP